MNKKRFEISKKMQKQNVFLNYVIGIIVCVLGAGMITGWVVKNFSIEAYENYILIGLSLIFLLSAFLLFHNNAYPTAFEITPSSCIVSYNDNKQEKFCYEDTTIVFQIEFNQLKRKITSQSLKFSDSSGKLKKSYYLENYYESSEINSLLNELAKYTLVRIEDGRTGKATEKGPKNDL